MKLAATYATEVFVNVDGGLSIAQNPGTGDDDVSIYLSREQARLVAAEIMRLDGNDGFWPAKKVEVGNGASA